MVEEEKFFAWLDGELPADEAARVEAEVAADPDLRRKADEHRAMESRLKGAFSMLAQAPVPEAIVAAVSPSQGDIVDLAARRQRRRFFAIRQETQWAAMAAALALGVALGTTVRIGSDIGPVEVRSGRLYAASAIDRALDKQLASAATGDVRVSLTFRDQAGAICRTFQANGSSGLACRDDGRWRLRGLFAVPEGQATDYRMAEGADPRLMNMVDQSIAGEPFDAAQEKAAMEKGWR